MNLNRKGLVVFLLLIFSVLVCLLVIGFQNVEYKILKQKNNELNTEYASLSKKYSEFEKGYWHVKITGKEFICPYCEKSIDLINNIYGYSNSVFMKDE